MVRALYQRESYAAMKEVGFSASQANRFRAYAPSSVLDLMREVSDKISELAWGLAIANKESDEDSGIFNDLESYYEDAYDDIRNGFENSRLSYEDWENYGEEEAG
jgi:hypothetical protein